MITQEQLDQFDEQGYLRVPGVLQPEDFAAVRPEFAELLRERVGQWCDRRLVGPEVLALLVGDFEQDLLTLSKTVGFDTELLADLDICLPHSPFSAIQPDSPFHVGPGLLRLISTPLLLDTVEPFIGSEISVSGNAHIRLKLPAAQTNDHHVGRSAANAAAVTPWHTDGITMAEASMDTPLITVWIPLRDVGPDDGCLRVVPGSHHVPDSVPWQASDELRADLTRKSVAQCADLGDVIILHKHVAHASAPNVSETPRWSFDLRFFDNTKPGDRPWFPSIPLRSKVAPNSVVTSGEVWRTRWEDARARLSASGRPLPGRPVYARVCRRGLPTSMEQRRLWAPGMSMTVMSYVIGVGLDLVEVQTLEVTLRRTPDLAPRLFRPDELSRSVESLAGHFAAKEALAKALGGGDLPWTDVEIASSETGAPRLQLSGSVRARARALGVVQIHLSITHDGGIAAAIVLLVAETRPTEAPDNWTVDSVTLAQD